MMSVILVVLALMEIYFGAELHWFSYYTIGGGGSRVTSVGYTAFYDYYTGACVISGITGIVDGVMGIVAFSAKNNFRICKARLVICIISSFGAFLLLIFGCLFVTDVCYVITVTAQSSAINPPPKKGQTSADLDIKDHLYFKIAFTVLLMLCHIGSAGLVFQFPLHGDPMAAALYDPPEKIQTQPQTSNQYQPPVGQPPGQKEAKSRSSM